MPVKTLRILIIAAIIVVGMGEMAGAEKKDTFPQKAINYIVGFAPGGKDDIEARGIAPYLSKYLGVRIIIQNYPGAGGRIGYTKLFNAKPDGYTIGGFPLPAVIVGEYLATVGYKTQEFTPIYACFVIPKVLAVPVDTYQNIEEFTKAGRSKSLSNAAPGHGTASHLLAIVVAQALGLKDVKHVQFEGAGAPTALAGKHVDFSITNLPTILPLVRAGKVKPLLMIDDERHSAFPQVPTPKEFGWKMTTINGIDGVTGPPNMPLERVKILEKAFAKAAADPAFLDWAQKAGISIKTMDHDKYRQETAEIVREVEKYKEYLVNK
jgi:tripartite-type tricarboxylate transporter receptor subunit TctC